MLQGQVRQGHRRLNQSGLIALFRYFLKLFQYQLDVVTIEKNATLAEAAGLMQKNYVGSLVVMEGLNEKKSL